MARTYQTPLGRARGLGAAGEGSHHWWRQRVTSVALVPLSLWLAVAVAHWPDAGYAQVVAWIGIPWNAVLLLSCILLTTLHASLGIEVVIEDYVHLDWAKMLAVVAVKLILAFVALTAAFATLRIALVGG
ncbi:MAG: succinate dehydrogenase, hydrophobic membrane anchor protein [Methylococcaceae bacterium]|nr:succinate dehydrogenase, hydrophobic membrane anchor protein [Methylococcaceae bacterium]